MDNQNDVTPPGGTRSKPPPGATAPKIITPGQIRVMLTVLVVAIVAAAGIVSLWWVRR